MKPIPIEAAKRIVDQYGYDQVVVVARKIGKGGGEHCTTYGRDKDNCAVAAKIGDFFKHELMRWVRLISPLEVARKSMVDAAIAWHAGPQDDQKTWARFLKSLGALDALIKEGACLPRR